MGVSPTIFVGQVCIGATRQRVAKVLRRDAFVAVTPRYLYLC
jgi:hypothetical protein